MNLYESIKNNLNEAEELKESKDKISEEDMNKLMTFFDINEETLQDDFNRWTAVRTTMDYIGDEEFPEFDFMVKYNLTSKEKSSIARKICDKIKEKLENKNLNEADDLVATYKELPYVDFKAQNGIGKLTDGRCFVISDDNEVIVFKPEVKLIELKNMLYNFDDSDKVDEFINTKSEPISNEEETKILVKAGRLSKDALEESEKLNETTNKELNAKEEAFRKKVRQALKDNGDSNSDNMVGWVKRLPEDIVKELEQEEAELRCISMLHSILTYSNNRDIDILLQDRYLQKYIDELGIDKVKELATQEINEFNNAEIINDVYTDTEGVTYNSVKFKDESENLNESATEDYWDATELDRVGFYALLKFNHPEEHMNPSMQYIITNDNNEVYRFAMNGSDEKNKDIGAKIEFRRYINKEECEKKLKEAETEAGNDFDEIASYMYQDAHNDIDSIPTREEMDYIADVTNKEYKELYSAVKKAIENVEGHFYNGMIELSDRATMNSLNTIEDESKYDDANQTYAELRDKALEDFTAETGVGVWQDGRSGRHIVVEDDYYNARDYDKLCAIQEKYEQQVIDKFNNAFKESENNKNKSIYGTKKELFEKFPELKNNRNYDSYADDDYMAVDFDDNNKIKGIRLATKDTNESENLNESFDKILPESKYKEMNDDELDAYVNFLKEDLVYHTHKRREEILKDIQNIEKILTDRGYYIDYSNPENNTIKFDDKGNEITSKD